MSRFFHLEIAKWLLEIQPQINISVFNEDPFRSACERGHSEIAKWLLKIKPQIDISAHDEYAFRSACERGHLEVGEWLRTLKPYFYVIVYNKNGVYKSNYVRTIEEAKEAKWNQIKYLIWLSCTCSPNKSCILYKLPFDISRYIIQNFF